MVRRCALLAVAGLLFSATAAAALPSGSVPAHAWGYLAPNVATQQDVLDLFGAPAAKVDVKADKFLRRLDAPRAAKIKPCLAAGQANLWKYRNVNVRKGSKLIYDDRRDSEFTYLAFHDDGRLCAAIPYGEDF